MTEARKDVTPDELDEQEVAELPDREEMSVVAPHPQIGVWNPIDTLPVPSAET